MSQLPALVLKMVVCTTSIEGAGLQGLPVLGGNGNCMNCYIIDRPSPEARTGGRSSSCTGGPASSLPQDRLLHRQAAGPGGGLGTCMRGTCIRAGRRSGDWGGRGRSAGRLRDSSRAQHVVSHMPPPHPHRAVAAGPAGRGRGCITLQQGRPCGALMPPAACLCAHTLPAASCRAHASS